MSSTHSTTGIAGSSHTTLRDRLGQQLTLGVGPMSANCVAAAIEIANEYELVLTLIASRRQIEADFFGSGYVNRWSTREFVAHVRGQAVAGSVVLGRDHGGPWQGTKEEKLDYDEAMAAAKRSFAEDIDCGVELLHIDPVCQLDDSRGDVVETYVARTIDLYRFCHEYAEQKNRTVAFEVGTELGAIGALSVERFCQMVDMVLANLSAQKLPMPTFVVVPNGTRVMEMNNIGFLSRSADNPNWFALIAKVREAIDFCHQRGLLVKAHNSDYLPTESLELLARMKIDAVNVAPEFGVVESRALLALLDDLGLKQQADDFIAHALASKRWQKWMLPDTAATMTDRALIAGHYIFSTPEFVAIKTSAARAAQRQRVDLDQQLQQAVRESIFRYLNGLGIDLRRRGLLKVG